MIAADPEMPIADKERLIRSFARALADLTEYVPGPDMGTDETCMAWVYDEIGRAVGLPAVLGGVPLDEIGATGFGLAASIDVAASRIGMDLHGARVAVQGFGAVGSHVARFLAIALESMRPGVAVILEELESGHREVCSSDDEAGIHREIDPSSSVALDASVADDPQPSTTSGVFEDVGASMVQPEHSHLSWREVDRE